jgi:hypothetical protein
MIKTVYTTDPAYVKYLDCNPGIYRRVAFQSCNLDIKQGSSVLSTISLCDFKLESLGSGDLGGCGGSLKRSVTLRASSNYILTAPEVGQEQGEVQLIVIKVKYDSKIDPADRYLTWEYKGSVYPISSMMVLTGRTEPAISWHGWDLSYYSNNPPSPDFSPQIFPPVSSPDLTFGGIMFTNPNQSYDTELEIFVFN